MLLFIVTADPGVGLASIVDGFLAALMLFGIVLGIGSVVFVFYVLAVDQFNKTWGGPHGRPIKSVRHCRDF